MPDSFLARLAEVEVLADAALVPHAQDRTSTASIAGHIQVLNDARRVDLLSSRAFIADFAKFFAFHQFLEDVWGDSV